jgi:hypothetical protein
VSKWLYKTGKEDPNRPLPPLGWTLEKSRKKRDTTRLAKHATKRKVKQVYTADELPQIHEALIKRGLYSILDVNVNTDYLTKLGGGFKCKVDGGFYLPVMYRRERTPMYSLIYATQNSAEIAAFEKILKDLRLSAVLHPGVSDFSYDYARAVIRNHRPEDPHPDYDYYMELTKNPPPFWWGSCTTYQRRIESTKSPSDKICTIG